MSDRRRASTTAWFAAALALVALPCWLALPLDTPQPRGAANGSAMDRERSAPSSAAVDGAVAAPREAAEREPAAADRRVVRGRVVYASNGDGVPFCRVLVRDGAGTEDTPTDRDGSFTTLRGFAADAVLKLTDTAVGGRPRTSGLFAPGDPPVAIATTEPAGEWVAASSFGASDALRIPVAMGPTYFVRTTLPPGIGADGVMALLGALPDDLYYLREFAPNASLRPVPGEPDLLWCRFGRPIAVARDLPMLVVAGQAGSWQGKAAVKQVIGAQREPVVVVIDSPAVVRGTVRRRSGVPRPNLFVELALGERAGFLRMTSRTDDDGRYEFDGVQPGPARLEVATEDVEPWREALALRPGALVERDITLVDRRLGGMVAGTITTDSGEAFLTCSVVLRSRDDTSVWRAANIHWEDIEGRQRARWMFENVPIVPCEVELVATTPCSVDDPVRQVLAPADRIEFVVHDRVPTVAATFRVVDREHRAIGECVLAIVGERGWSLLVERADAAAIEVDLPVGQAFAWRLVGAVRARSGSETAVAGRPLDVTIVTEPGWSLLLTCADAQNRHPLAGVTVLADGAADGVTDTRGALVIDRARRPDTLVPDPRGWQRVFDGPPLPGGREQGRRDALPAGGGHLQWRVRPSF